MAINKIGSDLLKREQIVDVIMSIISQIDFSKISSDDSLYLGYRKTDFGNEINKIIQNFLSIKIYTFKCNMKSSSNLKEQIEIFSRHSCDFSLLEQNFNDIINVCSKVIGRNKREEDKFFLISSKKFKENKDFLYKFLEEKNLELGDFEDFWHLMNQSIENNLSSLKIKGIITSLDVFRNIDLNKIPSDAPEQAIINISKNRYNLTYGTDNKVIRLRDNYLCGLESYEKENIYIITKEKK